VQIRIAEERESSYCRRLGGNGTHRLLSIWSISTGVLFCLCASWSFATPIGAAQDEPAQLVKAASVVRGEIVGPTVSRKSESHLPVWDRAYLQICAEYSSADRCNRTFTVVKVPESFADFAIPSCYRLSPKMPAGCAAVFGGSGRETTTITYDGRYPPLYYAIVGLPSLAWHTDMAVYLMRLLSGLLCALFLGLALALATVWSASRLLVLAVAVTVTPMVIIFGSVVNPTGLECATAVCLWTGGLILMLDHANDPPPSLIAATASAASVMVLTRGLSPLWLAIIAICLTAAAPRSLPVLLQRQSVRIAIGVVTFASVVAVTYIFWAHSLYETFTGPGVPPGTSDLGVVELALGRTGVLVQQFVGSIGWVETSPPLAVLGLWILAASAIVGLGLLVSQRHHAALIVASVVLPTVLMVAQSRTIGFGVWQARDGFPLYAGILLVAGGVAGRNCVPTLAGSSGVQQNGWAIRRLALMVAITVALAQIGLFFWALRRYTVGLGSVVNPLARVADGWSPPIPSIALVIAATIVIIVYGWWITCLRRLQDFAEPILHDPEMAMNVPGDGVVGTPHV
jgi:hypothetical protein